MAVSSKKATYWKKLFSAASVSFFTVFSVLFFGPLEIFLGNIIEFKFAASTATAILGVLSFIVAAILSVGISFLPSKILRPINLVIFSGGLCVYVQSIFLNGHMISLTGDKTTYSTGLIVGNLAVWFLIFVVVFASWLILQKHKKSKQFFFAMRFIALALFAMQTVGFVSAYAKMDKNINVLKNSYFTDQGKFELSDGQNTVYFVVDTCDGALISKALEQYPDMFDGFNGFTYFPNMSTTHSRTYPSVPYLLSGQMCYFDKPYVEYVNSAFEDSTFIPDMNKLGADIRLFTESQYIGNSVTGNIDNHAEYNSSALSSMNVFDFIKQSIKVSAYRVAPYILKDKFAYTSSSVNSAAMKTQPSQSVLFDDVKFCLDVKTDGLTVTDNYDKSFRFYHLFGTHPGAVIGAEGQHKPGVSQVEATRGCLYLIEQYIAQMKAEGVFENSTIIITADHGFSAASDDLSLPCATSCVMLVKPAGANSNEPIKTSLAPVCHEDLFATVIESLGGDYSEYGRTIWEIDENEDRERKYYHTALYSDTDGEVALREYVIKGDARNLENYHLTEKYWDVKYSERAVSKSRLND